MVNGNVHVDAFGKSLDERIEEINVCMRIQRSPFFNFYLACGEEKLDNLIDYFTSKLSIDKSCVHQYTLGKKFQDEGRSEPEFHLHDIAQDIMQKPDERFLVLFTGFCDTYKEFVDPEKNSSAFRFAHDYDQDNFSAFRNKELYRGKKLLVLTHLGKNAGELTYRNAIISANGSQHKYGIILIDPFSGFEPFI